MLTPRSAFRVPSPSPSLPFLPFTLPLPSSPFPHFLRFRRDIQKRHELAHAKERPGEDLQDVPKPPPAPRTKRTAPATSVPTQLSKVMRISRACNRCSKSKLRCDGEATCSRW